MLNLLALAITIAAVLIGYTQSRRFVQNRLRFVDAVHGLKAPIIAGVVAGLVALPVVAFVPLIHAGTALLFGASVGFGVASGARDIRKRLGPGEV